MAFAQTLLPVNIFRAPNIRTFLSKLIEYKVFQTIKQLRRAFAIWYRRLKKVDYYGLQLDHWTNIKCKTVLLVSISHLSKDWKQSVQIIDFKEVNVSKATTTATEVNETLENNFLDVNKCLAWQSDNCNAMIAASRKFHDENYESITERDEIQNIGVCFVGCGGHRLNNTIQDAVNDVLFFRQLNSYCKKKCGPGLCTTRWYGHFRQVEFCIKNIDDFNASISLPTNYTKYSALDGVVLQQFFKVLNHLTNLGKFFEEETPQADQLVPKVRKIQLFLQNLLDLPYRDPVKVFVRQVIQYMDQKKRFQSFPDILLTAAILNPSKTSRNCLTEPETVIATANMMQFSSQTNENVQTITQEANISTDMFDQAFENVSFHVASENIVFPHSIESELKEFRETVDVDMTAYDFFRRNRAVYKELAEVARKVLSILPSPACAERGFSKASFLTEDRKNQLKMCNLKERLINFGSDI